MSENKFLKCTCAQCGGHIEFPADGLGMTIPCPHCGWQTELTLAAPEQTSARSPRSLKWVVAGAIILMVGVVGVIGALLMARHLLNKPGAQRVTTASRESARKTNRTATVIAPGSATTPSVNITNGFSASGVRIEKTPGSTLVYAVGTVKNETERQRFDVTVEIDVLDAAGRKLGMAKDYKDTIEPHRSWTFRALLLQKGVNAARVAAVREQQ